MSPTWLSCTKRRLGAWQDCPVLEKPRAMLNRAAFSRSPSVNTMFADLPPSSRQTRLTVCAAASPTRTPASVDPVNEIEVHIGVARHRFAHDAAAANDQVEDAWRRPRLVHHLGQRHARDGRCIRWLQHHGAARCDAVDHLHDGLLHRPVPRRDQRADADRLAANNRVGQLALEVIVAEHVASDSHVSWRTGHLRGERDRHPDLLRDQLRELVLATLIGGDDPINQGDPLFDRRLREGCESTLCRGDRAVNIGHRPPRRDCCPWLLARRIDQRPRALAAGVDPGAVDVQLSIMFHVMPPQNETSMAPMTSPRQLADRAVLEHLLSDHSTDTTGEQE